MKLRDTQSVSLFGGGESRAQDMIAGQGMFMSQE
jgi:hypothetical protein